MGFLQLVKGCQYIALSGFLDHFVVVVLLMGFSQEFMIMAALLAFNLRLGPYPVNRVHMMPWMKKKDEWWSFFFFLITNQFIKTRKNYKR